MKHPVAIIILLLNTFFSSLSYNEDEVNNIFQKFESGLKNANVDEFYMYLDSEIYLNLGQGISGYFSSNQSYYLINNFLQECNPISFSLYKKEIDEDSPSALGSFFYNRKGIRGNYKVFLALTKTNSGWKISQISFN